jgi:hypothetical protein
MFAIKRIFFYFRKGCLQYLQENWVALEAVKRKLLSCGLLDFNKFR